MSELKALRDERTATHSRRFQAQGLVDHLTAALRMATDRLEEATLAAAQATDRHINALYQHKQLTGQFPE